nr:MAG TPA: hypothetical protein [Bacteriophage sp.]
MQSFDALCSTNASLNVPSLMQFKLSILVAIS